MFQRFAVSSLCAGDVNKRCISNVTIDFSQWTAMRHPVTILEFVEQSVASGSFSAPSSIQLWLEHG
jgi:hypothetical protein